MIYVDGYVPNFRTVIRLYPRSETITGTGLQLSINGSHYQSFPSIPQFFPDLPPFNPPAHWLIPPGPMRPLRCTAPLSGRAAPRPIRLAQGRSGKRTRATHAMHGRRG